MVLIRWAVRSGSRVAPDHSPEICLNREHRAGLNCGKIGTKKYILFGGISTVEWSQTALLAVWMARRRVRECSRPCKQPAIIWMATSGYGEIKE